MVCDRFQSSSQPTGRFWSWALLSMLLLGNTITPQSAVALPNPSRPLLYQLTQRQSSETRLPRSVVRQVKQDLAARLNVPQRDLEIASFSQESWTDSCLGLAAPNERCAMMMVEGWRVEVTHGEESWFYRVDETAQILRLEVMDTATLPPDVMDRLLLTVAQEVGVPPATLRVTETQPAAWDGCMGIYQPNQGCNRMNIPGWQVVLAGETQSWVYHVSQDSSRIVQNSTASGSKGGLVPSFIPTEGQEEPILTDETVVFQVEVAGGFGMRSQTVLMADGTIYRRVWQLNAPVTSDPVIEQRLSPQQVQEFQQVLQAQRFPNMNGLRYITDAAFADYPTTTFQAMGSQVAYIDLEQNNLPVALQTVIQAWDDL